jgi:electron transport complex protein RnfG
MIAPKPALQLGLFALISAAFLAGLHTLTRETIQQNEARRTAELLAYVMPESSHAAVKTSIEIDGKDQQLWQVFSGEDVVGVVLPVTAEGGYSGDIELLVGIDRQHQINGVRVTRHRETPGLGDKIDTGRSDWIDSFDRRSLENPHLEQWAVKKDGGIFDQFTGATITPRAVVRGVRDSLAFSQQHHLLLYRPAPKASTEEEQP